MDGSVTFLYIVYFISIIELAIAGVLAARYIIPLQWRQSKIKNGLVEMRKYLLNKGILAEVVIVTAIFCLTARFYITNVTLLRYMITSMILVFATGILGKVIYDYKIYHAQFSEKSKKLHEKIAKMEASDQAKIDSKAKK